MNPKLEKFARQELIDGLHNLPEKHFNLFLRMYSGDDLTRSIEDAVNQMPAEKLDRAMSQVQRSLDKQKEKPDQQTYTPEEVAEACGVPITEVVQWQERKQLKGFWDTLSRQFKFPLELNTWIPLYKQNQITRPC